MGALEMGQKDLLELYQLSELYERTYGGATSLDMGKLKREIAERYRMATGMDIRMESNPRKAGRRKKYTKEANDHVMDLYEKGLPLRRISEESGCSVGHVQDVINERKRIKTIKVYGN